MSSTEHPTFQMDASYASKCSQLWAHELNDTNYFTWYTLKIISNTYDTFNFRLYFFCVPDQSIRSVSITTKSFTNRSSYLCARIVFVRAVPRNLGSSFAVGSAVVYAHLFDLFSYLKVSGILTIVLFACVRTRSTHVAIFIFEFSDFLAYGVVLPRGRCDLFRDYGGFGRAGSCQFGAATHC